MKRPTTVHLCSFQAAPPVTRRTTYEQFRADVLAAGRFSCFEASDNPRAARFYTQLCKDPTVETIKEPEFSYPWTGVREAAE